MRPRLRFALGAVLAALLSVPARAEPALFAVRGGTVPVYLFGSIHVLKEAFPPPTPVWRQAFGEARQVWVEIVDQPTLATLLALVSGIDRTPLHERLDDDDYATLWAVMEAKDKRAMNVVDHLKPWLAAMVVYVIRYGDTLDGTERPGVDQRVETMAATADKPVRGLETIGDLAALLDAIPMERQVAMLHEVLASLDAPEAAAVDLEAAWREGDLPAVQALLDSAGETNPVLMGALLGERNRRWTARIVAMLNGSEPAFVTVGAGHLTASADGLPALLRERGYTIERLQ